MPKRKAKKSKRDSKETEDIIIDGVTVPKDIWRAISRFFSLRQMSGFKVNHQLKFIFGKLIKERLDDLVWTYEKYQTKSNCLAVEKLREETGIAWKRIEGYVEQTPWDGVVRSNQREASFIYDLKHHTPIIIPDCQSFALHSERREIESG
eukprot:TRINITY_DN7327_c0_g1_i3.p1 TRINITY_DN7327_c0_g1~~TRINITY_DN7327_c0_g1_i3.p1  ORF type:complete len:150 (-),score=17.48 TRINITY_DN7327_c0_g1_i3:521-970(-)